MATFAFSAYKNSNGNIKTRFLCISLNEKLSIKALKEEIKPVALGKVSLKVENSQYSLHFLACSAYQKSHAKVKPGNFRLTTQIKNT